MRVKFGTSYIVEYVYSRKTILKYVILAEGIQHHVQNV
jgi:hypothetical protein